MIVVRIADVKIRNEAFTKIRSLDFDASILLYYLPISEYK